MGILFIIIGKDAPCFVSQSALYQKGVTNTPRTLWIVIQFP